MPKITLVYKCIYLEISIVAFCFTPVLKLVLIFTPETRSKKNGIAIFKRNYNSTLSDVLKCNDWKIVIVI
ncbi:hypothetical protein TYRP_009549 [Tyrophagus putrescentiae]|nr:hypothetical protein TYRP_009549 [Tyrophagus putrescentiae]